MHVYIDETELGELVQALSPHDVVQSAQVRVVPGGVEVRAVIGQGSLGVRMGLSCEPGRGLHVAVSVLDPDTA